MISKRGFTVSENDRKRWRDMNVVGQVLTVLREHSLTSNKTSQNNRNKKCVSNEALCSSNDYSASTHRDALPLNEASSTSQICNDQFSSALLAPNQPKKEISINRSSAWSSYFSYIAIPASYKPGICLFAHRDTDSFNDIMNAEELALLE